MRSGNIDIELRKLYSRGLCDIVIDSTYNNNGIINKMRTWIRNVSGLLDSDNNFIFDEIEKSDTFLVFRYYICDTKMFFKNMYNIKLSEDERFVSYIDDVKIYNHLVLYEIYNILYSSQIIYVEQQFDSFLCINMMSTSIPDCTISYIYLYVSLNNGKSSISLGYTTSVVSEIMKRLPNSKILSLYITSDKDMIKSKYIQNIMCDEFRKFDIYKLYISQERCDLITVFVEDLNKEDAMFISIIIMLDVQCKYQNIKKMYNILDKELNNVVYICN